MKFKFLLFFLTLSTFSFSQNWEWAVNNGATGSNDAWDVFNKVDPFGNVVYIGTFNTNTTTLGGQTFSNASTGGGTDDIFIAKYDASGNYQWGKVIGGPDTDHVEDLVFDSNGNLYVVGGFSGTAAFGDGISAFSTDQANSFILKINAAGVSQWVKKDFSSWSGEYSRARAVEIDSYGDLLVSGEFSADTLFFGGTDYVKKASGINNDTYIIKLNSNGVYIWGANTGIQDPNNIRLHKTNAGRFYYTSSFSNSVLNITQPIANIGGSDIVLIRCESNGTPVWSRGFGGAGDEEITSMEVDNAGLIYLTGGFSSANMNVGGTILDAPSGMEMFIVKYTQLGTVRWAKDVSGTGLRYGSDIKVNSWKLYFTGLYDGQTFDFTNGATVPATSNFNSFVAIGDTNGHFHHVLEGSSTDTLIYRNISFFSDGSAYVSGSFRGANVQFGTNQITTTATGVYDFFLAKLNTNCNLSITTSTTTSACGDANGEATVSINGGNAPYNITWTNGDTLATADSLSAGIYQVTVTDDFGCIASKVVAIQNQNGPIITVETTGTNNLTCFQSNDGNINTSISGGTAPFTVRWDNGVQNPDLTNVSAGAYTLEVTDANGCISSETVVITQPDPVIASISTTPASCGSADGTATVSTSGGTSPYTYLWSNSGTNATQSNLSAGFIGVMAIDANGCKDTAVAVISEANAPTITIDSVLNASCASGGGDIYVTVTGGSTPYTYNWSNGSTTEDQTNLFPDEYYLTVSGSNSCSANAAVEVPYDLPDPVEICMVTIDSVTENNMVVWEKPVVGHLAGFNVYQESVVAGTYNLLGFVEYDSLSQFIDTTATPLSRSYRYKISAVDTCGLESELSDHHATLHLAANIGIGGEVNCLWNHYEGFWYGTYNVYMYTQAGGWQYVNSFSSNVDSWTDLTPPNLNQQVYYVVEIVPDAPCVSTRAVNHNSTRSNRGQVAEPNGTGIAAISTMKAIIAPNPSEGIFYLSVNNMINNNFKVSVFDIRGELVLEKEGMNSIQNEVLDLSNHPSGMYFLTIQNGTEVITSKIIKK